MSSFLHAYLKHKMASKSAYVFLLSQNRRLQNNREFLSKQPLATDDVWRQTYNIDVFERRRFFMPAENKMAAAITCFFLLPESDWRLM
jgi:hypothetical protein